jgi:phage-related holin
MNQLLYIHLLLKYCTMEWLSLYSKYFIKLGISLKTMTSSPVTAVAGGTVVTLSIFSSVQKAILLLFLFFILDFITGILASWREKKQAEKENPKLKETSLISSDKLKLSAIKAFTYASAILSIYGIEKVFFIKTFKIDTISDEDMTITLIFVGFCCAIEFYSIVFENFKRMGYDIVKKFTNTVTGVKRLISRLQKDV